MDIFCISSVQPGSPLRSAFRSGKALAFRFRSHPLAIIYYRSGLMSTQNILVSQFWRNNENSFKGAFMAFQTVPDVIKYKIGSEKDPPEGGPFFFCALPHLQKQFI